MGANDRKISVTLDVGAEITRYKAAMSQIQTELGKLHIPDDLNTDIKNTFKNYSEQIKNLEQLIEKEGEELTPMNEKVIKENVANIEKTYKSLIKKLNSKGFQASVLEQDYKALELMEKAQDKYEKAVKDTNKQIKEQEGIINKAKEALERQRRITEQNKTIEADRKKKADDFRKSTAEEVSELKKRQEVLKNTNKEQEAQQKYRTEHKNTLRGWSQSKARTQALEEDRKAQEELIEVSTRLQEIDKTQINLDNELATATKDVEKAQTSLNKKEVETAATISIAEDKLKELKNILDTLSKDTLKEIKQQLSESGINWSEYGVDSATLNSYEELKQALTKVVETGGSRAVEVMKKISDASYQAGTAVKDAKGKIDTLGNSLDNLSERQKEIDRMSQSIVRFFSIGNAVQLFKRAIRSAVATIKDLDKVMTETAVVTDFSVADMWKQLPEYTARANKLGVTIHDVYEASTLYYQQGLKTNEVMQLTNATLKMARIAGLDAADATDRMTNALRGFNMEITETNADRVADVYSKLAAISASNVDEISTAMTKVASLASNANMKFETTAAFLAQIIETTRESAETAGTALKTVVARFSEVKELFSKNQLLGIDEEGEAIDVNKVSKALRTAGIDLNEYLTGVKGLDEIFMELAQKWDTLDQVQQRYIATMAAGSRQQSRFIAMMQNYKRTTELVTAAENAAGASNEQYEKTLESLESKLNQLKNSWNTFLMDVTNNNAVKIAVDSLTSFLNIVNSISDKLGPLVGNIIKMWTVFNIGRGAQNLFGKNGKAISNFMGFITDSDTKKLLSFPTILGKVSNGLLNSINNTSSLGDAFVKIVSNIEGKVIGAFKDFTSQITVTGKALLMTSVKILAVIVVLQALVTIFKAIKNNTPEEKVKRLNEAIDDSIKKSKEAYENYQKINSSKDSLKDKYKTIEKYTKGTENWKQAVQDVNESVQDLIESFPELAKYLYLDEDNVWKIDPKGIKEQEEKNKKEAINEANKAYKNEQEKKTASIPQKQDFIINQLDEELRNSTLGDQLNWGGETILKYAVAKGFETFDEALEDLKLDKNKISEEELKQFYIAFDKYRQEYFSTEPSPSEQLLNTYVAEEYGTDEGVIFGYLKNFGIGNYEEREKQAEEFYINQFKNLNKEQKDLIKKSFANNLSDKDISAAEQLASLFEGENLETIIINAIETARDKQQQEDIKQDPTEYSKAAKFVYEAQQAETFSKDQVTDLVNIYGLDTTDFIDIGEEYVLKADQETQEKFNNNLNNYLNDLLQKYLETAIMTRDWSAYNEVERTAGYYASNQIGTEKTEDYYKGARSSFMNSEAWENYNTELGENNLVAKAAAEENTDLADSLYSSANAASKLLPKFKELTDAIKDNAEALEEDDVKAIAEVTKAFNKAFGTDLSEEFIKNNKPALIDFANGVKGAYNQISDAILKSFINEDGVETKLEQLYNYIQEQDWDINGQMVLDAGPYYEVLANILEEGGETAKQLEADLKRAGITISWDTEWDELDEDVAERLGLPTRIPKKRIATLTNALGQQETINAGSGGSKKSSGGGGSSKPKYWDNPYDELYNLIEKQNEALRTRQKLEREYDRILKRRGATLQDLKKNILDEVATLHQEIDIQEQIQAGRVRMINELGSQGHRDSEGNLRSFDEWGASNYARYDFETNRVIIDWDAIDRINDPDKGGAIEAYISKLEELSKSFEETQDTIEEMYDVLEEIKSRSMEEYLEFEERVYQAIVDREQRVIDEYSALSDTINESNSNVLSSLRESIDLERQIRDNTKTEQEIADKEARLAYLQRDTSGANQQEILKLQKELEQARESYGDTLVDQSISNLETENEKAQQQREQQIEIMQAQLDWQAKNGAFWEETYRLINDSFTEDGALNLASPLVELLEVSDVFKGMSYFGKENWIRDMAREWLTAQEGYGNWQMSDAEQKGSLSIDGTELNYDSEKHSWTDANGDSYNVSYDNQTGTYSASKIEKVQQEQTQTNRYPSASNLLNQLSGYINPSDHYQPIVPTLQAGLNTLIQDGKLSGPLLNEDGYYGRLTRDKVAELQSLIGAGVDGNWGPETYSKLRNSELNQYKKGGLVSSTGLAWLDGTKSNPEMVLSARDTENFIALRNALTQMVAQGSGGGDNYFDIQIKVDEIASDYDVNKLAEQIKYQIVQDSMYRNVNAIGYIR